MSVYMCMFVCFNIYVCVCVSGMYVCVYMYIPVCMWGRGGWRRVNIVFIQLLNFKGTIVVGIIIKIQLLYICITAILFSQLRLFVYE